MDPSPRPIITSSSFDNLNAQIQAAALKTTKLALALPSDIQFHRSLDHELAEDLDAFSARLLRLTNNLLALAATVDGSQPGQKGKGKMKLETQDDLLDNFHSVAVDSMESLLERVVSLDSLFLRSG